MCPRGHSLRYVSGVRHIHDVHGLRSRSSLLAALRHSKFNFIIPCDDRIVAQLHELSGLHAELRPLIEYSLGDPSKFHIAGSRNSLLKVAADLDIRVPRTCVVTTENQAQQSFGQFAPVAVMKVDGTHGGEGVRMVRSATEAAAAFRSLRFGVGLLTSAQRLLIHGDPLALWTWARRARAEITMQEYISGGTGEQYGRLLARRNPGRSQRGGGF